MEDNYELKQTKAKLAKLEELKTLGEKMDAARKTHIVRPGRFGSEPTEALQYRLHTINTSVPAERDDGGMTRREAFQLREDLETEIERRKELAALQDRVANLEAGILASKIVENTQAITDIVSDWDATSGPQIKVEDTPGAHRAAATEAKLSANLTAIIDGLAKMCTTMIDALDKTAAKDRAK